MGSPERGVESLVRILKHDLIGWTIYVTITTLEYKKSGAEKINRAKEEKERAGAGSI